MADHELDALRREFLAEAEGKVAEMQASLSGANADSLHRVGYLAHQLKGSGGSYGYQTISAESAEIEKAVESVDARGVDQGVETKIREHVGRLKSEIDQRARELGRS